MISWRVKISEDACSCVMGKESAKYNPLQLHLLIFEVTTICRLTAAWCKSLRFTWRLTYGASLGSSVFKKNSVFKFLVNIWKRKKSKRSGSDHDLKATVKEISAMWSWCIMRLMMVTLDTGEWFSNPPTPNPPKKSKNNKYCLSSIYATPVLWMDCHGKRKSFMNTNSDIWTVRI